MNLNLQNLIDTGGLDRRSAHCQPSTKSAVSLGADTVATPLQSTSASRGKGLYLLDLGGSFPPTTHDHLVIQNGDGPDAQGFVITHNKHG
jgi:hypothetical protein